MDQTGVDFAMDVHGDEAIPANFLAGFEGIPSLTDRQLDLFNLFSETLERLSPDFQRRNLAAFCPEADCSRRHAQPPGDRCGR